MVANEGKKICIIGPGVAGLLTAVMLDKMGYQVTLISDSDDILTGASQIAFIWHDGSEYLSKTGDFTTTQHCVDGMLAFWQMFQPNIFKTNVCTRNNPARFFMSRATAEKGEISLEGLYANAEIAKQRYRERFEQYAKFHSVSDEQAAQKLFGLPDDFNRPLEPDEFRDVDNIIGGVATSAAGINMPVFYAYMQALIRKSNIQLVYNADIQLFEKAGDSYRIATNNGEFLADRVVVAAGHNTPKIIDKLNGAKSHEGAYFLNCMTKIRLPKFSGTGLSKVATANLLRQVGRINFSLRDEGGGSFICVTPPTEHEDGFAVSYYPTTKIGNQIRVRQYLGEGRTPVPADFDDVIKQGLSEDDLVSRKAAIFGQLCHLYPYLKGYITTEDMSFGYGSVFSRAVENNESGLDRSMRPLTPVNPITEDGQVIAVHSPKFTTGVITALEVIDALQKSLGLAPLPKSEFGYGAANLYIPAIVQDIGVLQAAPLLEDAKRYADRAGLPESVIRSRNLPLGFFAEPLQRAS